MNAAIRMSLEYYRQLMHKNSRAFLSVKRMLFLHSIVLSLFSALVAMAQQLPTEYKSLTTTDGKTYQSVRFKAQNGDRFTIIHKSGVAQLDIEQIPDMVRQDLGLPTSGEAQVLRQKAAVLKEAQELGNPTVDQIQAILGPAGFVLRPFHENSAWIKDNEVIVFKQDEQRITYLEKYVYGDRLCASQYVRILSQAYVVQIIGESGQWETVARGAKLGPEPIVQRQQSSSALSTKSSMGPLDFGIKEMAKDYGISEQAARDAWNDVLQQPNLKEWSGGFRF